MTLTYAPQVFDAPNEAIARQIILTAEFGHSTDRRWEVETPYLAELLASSLGLTDGMIVLDYGCGIGRLAKALIERVGCHVIGLDISYNMRLLGAQYVGSPRFTPVSPEAFTAMLAKGLTCDAAFSVWVLQHCMRPADDIALIHRALRPGGRACVVNNTGRAVPTHESGWVSDGISVQKLLSEAFTVERIGRLDSTVLPSEAIELSFIADLRKD